MKILLQHVRTRLFLKSVGSWAGNPEDAHDFLHSQRAIDFAHENHLTGVQIAIVFSDHRYDEVFPIPPSSGMPLASA